MVGMVFALNCISGNCVLFDDSTLSERPAFAFKNYKSRISCGGTVFSSHDYSGR